MKKVLTVILFLISASSFAQYTEVDEDQLRLGVGGVSSTLINSNNQLYGAIFKLRTEGGLFIPVSIQFGESMRSISLGLGFKTRQDMIHRISYAASMAFTIFHMDFKNFNEEDKNRLITVLQQEISYQISERISLGVQFNLDLVSRFEQNKRKGYQTTEELVASGMSEVTPGKYAKVYTDNTGYEYYNQVPIEPKYETVVEKESSIESIRKSNQTGFGVNLTVDLF